MSELINKSDNRATIRWKLLASVSAMALTAYVISGDPAIAGDAERPPIWIELGGQLQSLSNTEQTFSPAFVSSITQPNLLSALDVQKSAPFAMSQDGKILFQPDGSDWVFSASIQFGRSKANRHLHHQTPNQPVRFHATVALAPPYSAFDHLFQPRYSYFLPTNHVRFADGQSSRSENHQIVDFEAGKDVGLGMFGLKGSSVVSAGVRIASFASKSSARIRALPDLQYPTAPISASDPITNITQLAAFEAQKSAFRYATMRFHAFYATEQAKRSFHGVGPELSWSASAAMAGNEEDGELMFDWGVNAGILFGRQKVKGRHHTQTQSYHMTQWTNAEILEGLIHTAGGKLEDPGHFTNHYAVHCSSHYAGGCFHYTGRATNVTTNAKAFNRSRNVTVPNLGGFAGMSIVYSDVKVSIGYRADFFFGAVDGGVDTREEENRSFMGPFASISVGLGD